MKTFTRKEYNLVANALQKYDLYMSDSEKKIAEIIQDKLYYFNVDKEVDKACLLYTSPSPRDGLLSRMPSSA